MPTFPLVELRLLGAPAVRTCAGTEADAVLAQPKRLALLAYLAAATPSGFHRRDTLLALLWPEADQEHARTALRKAIHFLRHELGARAVVNRGDEIGLVEGNVHCDVVEFDRELASGHLPEALALYRGDLLPGFFVSDAPEFERWLEEERVRLRGEAAGAAWTLARRLEGNGDLDGAARWARWASTLAPDDEPAMRRLMALLGRLGDRGGAMHAHEEFAARLQREYGVTPSVETQALVSAVRAGQGEAAASSLAPSVVPMSHAAHDANALDGLPSSIGSRQYIAIFPFRVHGDGSAAYLREGLVDLLTTNLDHAGTLHSIDPHALLSIVGREAESRLDPTRAGELAQRFGADLYVLGSVVGVAGRLRISAAVHREGPTAASARYLSVSGQADQLFELVDELTAKLVAELHPGHGARLTRLAAATTASLPALKAYLAGEQALRAGRHVDAVNAFQQAVDQDPHFALGWYRLAFFLSWPALPQPSLSPEIMERALRLKERLTHRDRLLLEALNACLRGAANAAERLYQEILALHPEDVEAWIGLGQTLMFHNQHRGRLITESRAAFERVLALDPDNTTATLFLSYVAQLEGNFEECDRLLEHVPAESDFIHPRVVQVFGHGSRGDQEQAIAALSAAPDVAVYEATRFVATLTCNFSGARRIAQLLTDPVRSPEVRGVFHILAAFLSVAGGRLAMARRELTDAALFQPAAALEYQGLFAALPFLPAGQDELKELRSALAAWDAAAVPQSTHPYPGFDLHRDIHPVLRAYLLGAVNARLRDAAALGHAAELDMITGCGDAEALARDLAHSVRAQHAFWQGQPEVAFQGIQEVRIEPRQIFVVLQSPFYTETAERWLRAELLQQLGHSDEALRWYGSLAQASLFDLMYLAPSHLRRGEIHERLGHLQEAAEHYARFIDLWGECDPELRPAVAEATAKLERLQRTARKRDTAERLRIV